MKPDERHDTPGPRIDLAGEEDFSLGTIVVRPSMREVIVNGRPTVLEPRVMQVLVVLARAKGVVVSRDALVRQCWDGRAVGDDAINRCIAKVRKTTRTDPARSVSIETIRGVGYRLSVSDPKARATGTMSFGRVSTYTAAAILAAALILHAASRWWPG